MITRSKMSISWLLVMSALGFQCGWPGLEPKARARITQSKMSTIPSALTSPCIDTKTQPPVFVLSAVSFS